MLGIGSTELVLILFFGFLIFGPEKLPEMGRTVGRAIRQFRAASDEVNTKFREEVYDPFQEAIDPYKEEIEKTVTPIKDDIDAISDSFNETKKAFTDPLDLKGKREEAEERKKEFENAFSFGSKKEEEPSKAAKAKEEAQAAVSSAAKGDKGINVDDPFADAINSEPAASNSDELASLYDFDTKDGE